MSVKENYELARKIYAGIGVDTDKAIETLKKVPVSMHSWQGDDVMGQCGRADRGHSDYRKLSRKSQNAGRAHGGYR